MVARSSEGLDFGEASAIALALGLPGTLLLLDDLPARKVATDLGLELTRTVGVLISAKLNGDIPAIRPLLDDLERVSFRLSETIRSIALGMAGETP